VECTGYPTQPRIVKRILQYLEGGKPSFIHIKDTALVYAIGVIDLLESAKSQVNTMANVTPYIVAAVIYLLLNTLLTMLFHQLEKKFSFE
ncbi:MAG: amino acid ABC transporter permease, partial [Clostridiales bacterium]|nr:amino acid ABC transporter permease [Clostridiales bacterium]